MTLMQRFRLPDGLWKPDWMLCSDLSVKMCKPTLTFDLGNRSTRAKCEGFTWAWFLTSPSKASTARLVSARSV